MASLAPARAEVEAGVVAKADQYLIQFIDKRTNAKPGPTGSVAGLLVW